MENGKPKKKTSTVWKTKQRHAVGWQEQPALLDPFLEEMVEPLMCAIAAKVRRKDLDTGRAVQTETKPR